MAEEIVIAGTDEEEMLREALGRMGLPKEAVTYHVTTEEEADLLPGAKPMLQLHLKVRPEYLADQAMDHVESILNILGIEAEIFEETRDDVIVIQIASKTAASILIGREGQNLDALQHLITRMLLRSMREAPLVVIDVEHYRTREFDKLDKLGQRAIGRARETGNEIELDPMPPLERKYLHHILSTEEGISTFSRGDEPERYMVIIAD